MRMPQSLGVGGRANPGEFVSFREARVKFPGNEWMSNSYLESNCICDRQMIEVWSKVEELSPTQRKVLFTNFPNVAPPPPLPWGLTLIAPSIKKTHLGKSP